MKVRTLPMLALLMLSLAACTGRSPTAAEGPASSEEADRSGSGFMGGD